jgi:RecB family exonuclease
MNVVSETVARADAELSTDPSPEAMAARLVAGGSPFDFVEPPSWFSYSSFDSYERCPRQYAFRYLCHVPSDQPRPAADFGTAAHGAFEAFTRERRDRLARGEPGPSRSDLEGYFESAWVKTRLSADADADTWRRRAGPLLDCFWAGESASQAKTIGEELHFRLGLPLDSDAFVFVTGYIDRVDRLPSGEVEVIDYKSGSTASLDAARSSLQLSIYALACRDALDLGRPERVTLYCVEQSLRVSAERTDTALDALRDDLTARAREIRDSDFTPTPSSHACGWCDFSATCPAARRR